MNDNDLSWKIARVALPLLIYYVVNIIVQAVFGAVLVYSNIFKNSTGNYEASLNLLESIEKAVNSNRLLFTLIAALTMIPVTFFMMYKDGLYKKIKPVNFSGYGLLVPLGAFGAMGVGRFLKLFPLDNILGSYKESEEIISSSPIALQIIAVVIVVPFMEELLFRGIIYNRIKGYSDKIFAIYISSVLFGIYHMNLIQGLYAFVLGVVLALVYEYHESILAPFFLHICANGAVLLSGHNKLSLFIDSHIVARIIAAVVELGIFAVFMAFLVSSMNSEGHKKKRRKNN